MKKVILMAIICSLLIFITACVEQETSEVKETAASDNSTTTAATTIQSVEAAATSPTDEQNEGVLAYMDPKIDMLLIVNSVDWVYTKELYEGQVYFYPKDENPMATYNGFAISSQEVGDSTVEQLWDSIKSGFEGSVPGFEQINEKNYFFN